MFGVSHSFVSGEEHFKTQWRFWFIEHLRVHLQV